MNFKQNFFSIIYPHALPHIVPEVLPLILPGRYYPPEYQQQSQTRAAITNVYIQFAFLSVVKTLKISCNIMEPIYKYIQYTIIYLCMQVYN